SVRRPRNEPGGSPAPAAARGSQRLRRPAAAPAGAASGQRGAWCPGALGAGRAAGLAGARAVPALSERCGGGGSTVSGAGGPAWLLRATAGQTDDRTGAGGDPGGRRPDPARRQLRRAALADLPGLPDRGPVHLLPALAGRPGGGAVVAPAVADVRPLR